MTKRLSPDTLSYAATAVRRPAYDRAMLRPRMVHLGVGAFHRAHQASFTEDALEAEGGDWGTIGVSLRSDTAERQLAPQGGLYTVGVEEAARRNLRVIGNLLEVVTAPKDPGKALAALADPNVSIVTLTITEKGYALDPATGALSTKSDDIAHDLQEPKAPRSALGYLAEALRRRRNAKIAPFTAISCDNLSGNGAKLRAALLQYTDRVDPDLARWIETEGAFPMTMVDRIVPATTEQDITEAVSALQLRDEGYVHTEPFRQWVIQDAFCGPRPAWEKAGATISNDVDAFERAKLRLLNGPHSAIAYLGCLAGHHYVHDVMADPALGSFVTGLMDEEILPTVPAPPGLDLPSYAGELRDRFTNPALQHRTWQIAMDGSQKLPLRILDTIRDRIAAGAPYPRLATVVAAWMLFVRGRDLAGRPIDVRDPMAERLWQAGLHGGQNADGLVSAYLNIEAIFGQDLPRDFDFRAKLRAALDRILSQGIEGAAAVHSAP